MTGPDLRQRDNCRLLTRRQAGIALFSLAASAGLSRADSPDTSPATDSRFLHEVTLQDGDGTRRQITGRVLVRAADGGLLIEDRAGRLWTVTPEALVQSDSLRVPFSPLSAQQLGEQIAEELRQIGVTGDLTHRHSEHYTAVGNTSAPYVDWTLDTLERLHAAFHSYWSRHAFDTHDSEFPLPVVIVQSREDFARLAAHDRTPVSAQGQGYYLITANRTTLVDLTAGETASTARSRAEVLRAVSRHPASVTTVVHEATHQIAFNCGMHRRYADNPVWLTEGIAMYFETPDLNSRRGWRTIGRINTNRLKHFREFLATRRPPDSLQTLLQDNSRFAQAETAVDAYAEAWALTHFLLKKQPQKFDAYLRKIASKPRLQWDPPEQRLTDFTETFGALEKTEQALRRYIRRPT